MTRDHNANRTIALWIQEAKAVVSSSSTSIKDAKQATKCTFKSIASFFSRLYPRTLKPPSAPPNIAIDPRDVLPVPGGLHVWHLDFLSRLYFHQVINWMTRRAHCL
jgi:hypothetical protein